MEIQKYFNAEWKECALGIAIGLVTLGVATYLYFQGTNFNQGLAYVLFVFATIQLIVCVTVVVRTPKDIARVKSMIQQNRALITSEEIPRMVKVLKNFVLYRWAEIAITIVGAALSILDVQSAVISGIGAGLIIEGCIMLVFDFFAERRGKIYLNYLKTI